MGSGELHADDTPGSKCAGRDPTVNTNTNETLAAFFVNALRGGYGAVTPQKRHDDDDEAEMRDGAPHGADVNLEHADKIPSYTTLRSWSWKQVCVSETEKRETDFCDIRIPPSLCPGVGTFTQTSSDWEGD